jgi:hypothetical protein
MELDEYRSSPCRRQAWRSARPGNLSSNLDLTMNLAGRVMPRHDLTKVALGSRPRKLRPRTTSRKFWSRAHTRPSWAPKSSASSPRPNSTIGERSSRRPASPSASDGADRSRRDGRHASTRGVSVAVTRPPSPLMRAGWPEGGRFCHPFLDAVRRRWYRAHESNLNLCSNGCAAVATKQPAIEPRRSARDLNETRASRAKVVGVGSTVNLPVAHSSRTSR